MAEPQGNTKRCATCGAEKQLDQFREAKRPPRRRAASCAECVRLAKCEYMRLYRLANPEKTRAMHADWARRNKEKRQADTKAYYAKHRDKIRAESLRYQRADVIRTRSYQKKWRGLNPDKERRRTEAWEKAHPEWKTAKRNRRRTRITGAGGAYTKDDVARIYAEQCGRCRYCQKELHGKYHADHKIPVSRGGTSWPENIVCSCARCNLRKGKRTDVEFMDYLQQRPA